MIWSTNNVYPICYLIVITSLVVDSRELYLSPFNCVCYWRESINQLIFKKLNICTMVIIEINNNLKEEVKLLDCCLNWWLLFSFKTIQNFDWKLEKTPLTENICLAINCIINTSMTIFSLSYSDLKNIKSRHLSS